MNSFWIISDADPSGKQRFDSLERAITTATQCINNYPRGVNGVVILQAVKLVSREHPPVKVEDIVVEPPPKQEVVV